MNNNVGSLVKGIVVSSFNQDPLSLNRAQVYIPCVHGDYEPNRVGSSGDGMYPWAQCLTHSVIHPATEDCPQMDLYSVPKVGTTVWIMFETNNPEFPVIVGKHMAGLYRNK